MPEIEVFGVPDNYDWGPQGRPQTDLEWHERLLEIRRQQRAERAGRALTPDQDEALERAAEKLLHELEEITAAEDAQAPPALSALEATILFFIRRSRHRVVMGTIAQIFAAEHAQAVSRLVAYGLIQQDSRDTVEWSDPQATFYTAPAARAAIDQCLKQVFR